MITADQDQLINTNEYRRFCFPNVDDTDHDGLTDWVEFSRVPPTCGYDPDSDDDGIMDGLEVLSYNTNPMNSDTDGDYLNDGLEVTYGSDPNSANMDQDNDFMPNEDELAEGYAPYDPDMDGDGLLDGYEFYTRNTDPQNGDVTVPQIDVYIFVQGDVEMGMP